MTKWFRWVVALVVCAITVASGRATFAQRSEIAAPLHLSSITMITPAVGWATAGNVVFRTSDGGHFWQDVTPRGALRPAELATFFRSGSRAWIAISRGTDELSLRVTVFRTADAGLHWHAARLAQRGGVEGVQRLAFADNSHGWLLLSEGVGAGQNPYVLVHTRDGGAHWFPVARSNAPAPAVFPGCDCTTAITFRNAINGFSTGTQFAYPYKDWLYQTHDSGHAWRRLNLPLPRGYIATYTDAPRFFGQGRGVLLAQIHANTSTARFRLYQTDNGGNSWTGTSIVPGSRSTAGFTESFVDQRHGWVTDGSLLYLTFDGGAHWAASQPAVPAFARAFWTNGATAGLTAIDFVNQSTGFALNQDAMFHKRPYILQTTDGGRTWRAVYTLSLSRPNS